MHGFFITATNTDRGKTLVTAGLRLWIQKQGLHCLAMKPVQTGMQGQSISPDLYQIYAASHEAKAKELDSSLLPLLPLLQPFCYEDACSPHLAAERDVRPYADIASIQSCIEQLQLQSQTDFLLVEGAGGFYVPLSRQETMAELAAALNFPVILVAQSGLGAINDTCLSLKAIQEYGLTVAGFLLNDGPELTDSAEIGDAYIREDNPRIIAELSGANYLGTLPCLRQNSSKDLEQNWEQDLRGKALLEAFQQNLSGLGHLLSYLPQSKAKAKIK